MVQWLGLSTFIAKGLSSIPGWGTKNPQAVQSSKEKKKGNLAPLQNQKYPGGLRILVIASASDVALSMILEHRGETSRARGHHSVIGHRAGAPQHFEPLTKPCKIGLLMPKRKADCTKMT